MSTEFKKRDFGAPIEIIDPHSSKFQEGLAEKAGMLAEEMLDSAMSESDVRVQASALNAYTKYRHVQNEDLGVLLDKLSLMEDKKLAILEKALKQRGVLEDMKAGKLTLAKAYNLPKKKK